MMTDQCVESAVRDACDLGYLVTLVSDACTTDSAESVTSSRCSASAAIAASGPRTCSWRRLGRSPRRVDPAPIARS
jgi:hypothetical protein